MTSPNWNAILQVATSRQRECLQFQGIQLVDPIHIAIKAEPGQPEIEARLLFNTLKKSIQALGQAGVQANSCGGPQGLGCMARSEPACRSVLVVVTGPNTISNSIAHEMQNWVRGGAFRDVVLPILPRSASVAHVLTPALDKTGVLFNLGHIATLAPDVLRLAGVGGEDHRLFLSYRRTDAQDLADQLHDAFTHIGFKVFLDRFSGTPGRPFPQELAQELMDKGLVLVLETSQLLRSPWTLAEIAFAFLFRLGLLAVNINAAPHINLISSLDRFNVGRVSRGLVSQNVLAALLQFVRNAYARQLLRRRIYLESLLTGALAPHNIRPTQTANGIYLVNGGARQYKVHLASRPPGLSDARRVVSAAASTDAVILGSHNLLPPEACEDFRWLASQLTVGLVGEGKVISMANDMAGGRQII